LRGYEEIGCDALNVGGFEFSAGFPFLESLVASTGIPFISANIRDKATGDLVFDPYVILERGPFKIGVIGVTNLLPEWVNELTMDDYIKAGQAYIKKLRDKVDVLVLLLNAPRKDYATAGKAFKDVDYIFVSRGTLRTRPQQEQPPTGPFLYSSSKQGKYLSVINLTIVDPDSPFVDVSSSQKRIENVKKRFESLQKRDPKRSLEEIYADQPNILRLIKDYRRQMDEAERVLARAVNKSVYESVPLDRKVKDDPEMLAFIREVLAYEKELKGKNKKDNKKTVTPSSKLKKSSHGYQ